jgi:hypothetical protein
VAKSGDWEALAQLYETNPKLLARVPVALANRETSMTAANDLEIRRALEAAGVEFIDEKAVALDYASANAHGQTSPSDRWRANQTVPLHVAPGCVGPNRPVLPTEGVRSCLPAGPRIVGEVAASRNVRATN